MKIKIFFWRLLVVLVLSMMIFMDLNLGALVPLSLVILTLMFAAWKREDKHREEQDHTPDA